MVIQFRCSRPFAVFTGFLHSYIPKKSKKKELSTPCTGVGKTSLANTLESFLKSPTKSPESWSWLSENHPELLCTQVMQLYDGLSINSKEELTVEVEDHAQNVKLVRLNIPESPEAQMSKGPSLTTAKRDDYSNDYDSDNSDSDVEENTLSNNNQTNVQVKLVDLGGHTATV